MGQQHKTQAHERRINIEMRSNPVAHTRQHRPFRYPIKPSRRATARTRPRLFPCPSAACTLAPHTHARLPGFTRISLDRPHLREHRLDFFRLHHRLFHQQRAKLVRDGPLDVR